jgi:transcriptional regulator with XRE-family HTH domain
MKTDLGALLRAHRISQGLSLRQAATRIGVAFQTLDAWETGRATVSWERLEAWADAFGLDALVVFQPRERGEGVESRPLSEAQRTLRAAVETGVGLLPDEVALAMARWIALESATRP